MYELPHELQNDLRLQGNKETSRESQNFIEKQASANLENKILKIKTFEKQKTIFSRSVLFHLKTRVTLEYFVNIVSESNFLFGNLPQILSKLIPLKIW